VFVKIGTCGKSLVTHRTFVWPHNSMYKKNVCLKTASLSKLLVTHITSVRPLSGM